MWLNHICPFLLIFSTFAHIYWVTFVEPVSVSLMKFQISEKFQGLKCSKQPCEVAPSYPHDGNFGQAYVTFPYYLETSVNVGKSVSKGSFPAHID